MGIVYFNATVSGHKGSETLEFLVDSGAGYTVLPRKTWRKLGLVADGVERFRLADGTLIERKISECEITIQEKTRHTTVVLGEKDDAALLGVVTLEQFGLIINPFTRQILPMQMLMM
ncbi:MAG: aspartyl protease [Calditrichaeota bacterium]|nr:aspartyl protease [Calditrichota bacterium]